MAELERLAVDIDRRFVFLVRNLAKDNNVYQRAIVESALCKALVEYETTGEIDIANQKDFEVVDRILKKYQ